MFPGGLTIPQQFKSENHFWTCFEYPYFSFCTNVRLDLVHVQLWWQCSTILTALVHKCAWHRVECWCMFDFNFSAGSIGQVSGETGMCPGLRHVSSDTHFRLTLVLLVEWPKLMSNWHWYLVNCFSTHDQVTRASSGDTSMWQVSQDSCSPLSWHTPVFSHQLSKQENFGHAHVDSNFLTFTVRIAFTPVPDVELLNCLLSHHDFWEMQTLGK